jgi:cell division septation protein DedD
MSKFLWLVAGVAIGVVVAKQIEENPQARRAYEEAKASLQEFADAVAEGYKDRELELAKTATRSSSKATVKSRSKATSGSTAKKAAAKSKPAGK